MSQFWCGKIIHQYPAEPELKDIGLARQHFQSGYNDLWDLKERAKAESVRICCKLEQVFSSFKEAVYTNLEKEFLNEKNETVKLVRAGITFFPSSEDNEVYFDNHIINTIFERVVHARSVRIDGPQQTQVSNQESNSTFTIAKLLIPKGIIGYGRTLSMNILKSRVEALYSNETIRIYLNEFILLEQCLRGNSKINRTTEGVQRIWKCMYQEGQPIKGTCKRCSAT